MSKRTTLILATLMVVCLFAAGPVLAAEEEGIFEGWGNYEGYYDNDFGNDWFYDGYDVGVYDDEGARGYYGDEGYDWFTNDAYYNGIYDDDDYGNDWWFDSYDDPGDAGFWDI